MLFRALKGFPVKLAEGDSKPQVQVLRTGVFNHPQYGKFSITPQILAEMKSNFDAKVRGIDIALDYFHESGKEASGWISALELREDGTELWANVEWTPTAREKIKNKELKYFSPDFAFQWTDPETGVKFSNVLFGGGLTNRPFVKEMAAIAANEKGDPMTPEQIKALQDKAAQLESANVKLTEEVAAAQKQMAAMPPADEVAALKAKIAELEAALAKAQGEHAQMKEAAALAEKERAFNVLLTEGKACVAQKDAYLKGDMEGFIKLAQPLNTKGSGNAGSGDQGDREDKVIKLADAKQKENPKLDRGEALSLANKEIK